MCFSSLQYANNKDVVSVYVYLLRKKLILFFDIFDRLLIYIAFPFLFNKKDICYYEYVP